MCYELVIPSGMGKELRAHLLGDRTHEQMGIVLCGVRRSGKQIRLLGRHLVLMPRDAFSHQSAGGLTLDPAVQRHVLQLAAREDLSQVDFHTHPGDGTSVRFSGIDDQNERKLAAYLAKRIPGTHYGSVVLNGQATAARVWHIQKGQPIAMPMAMPELESSLPIPHAHEQTDTIIFNNGRFARQVQAFGLEFQRRLSALTVGVVGLGGLGSIIVEQLARLGVQNWVLIDPDLIESTNLNRLLGATARDVADERAKVWVAARTIRRSSVRPRIKALHCSVFAERALKALKTCDLLVVTTDNDASRLVLNALACQYVIPLVHVGVNLDPGEGGVFADVSGEFAIPPVGTWCLLCSGIIDAQRASWDLARPEERALLIKRGYLAGTPAPAVYHLNGAIASLAVAEIHNLVWMYKPMRRYMVYRELEGELMPLEVPQQESCLHCSPEGLLGLGDLAPLWTLGSRRSMSETHIPSAIPVPSEERNDGGSAEEDVAKKNGKAHA
ncbi:MAG: ThiF family adenylyltransferase [bacterium]|nr:ThiF family adenylyltransferase [bacterium]